MIIKLTFGCCCRDDLLPDAAAPASTAAVADALLPPRFVGAGASASADTFACFGGGKDEAASDVEAAFLLPRVVLAGAGSTFSSSGFSSSTKFFWPPR